MNGLSQGRYLLDTPDFGLQVHSITMQGMVPRRFPGVLLEMLLGFIAPIIHWVMAGSFDTVARTHAKTRFSRLWSSSA